ncbi:Ragulator complex protein LAMTOR1 [Galemys pyrenaicus]|uniref:Ragulator complex protein LAMTOR1 n=1 Tax=Galemys pyrenaicus TaxID=202257 RepID=A0A8J5ZZJ8_GALPY|nr:Ragulator complex protein LAMTOR1 [Galemys pyrenaicus]
MNAGSEDKDFDQDQAEPNYHSLPSTHTDELALLSFILTKTISHIMAVSAAHSKGMGHHEHMDQVSSTAAYAYSALSQTHVDVKGKLVVAWDPMKRAGSLDKPSSLFTPSPPCLLWP